MYSANIVQRHHLRMRGLFCLTHMRLPRFWVRDVTQCAGLSEKQGIVRQLLTALFYFSTHTKNSPTFSPPKQI